jgi:hypothetical protein
MKISATIWLKEVVAWLSSAGRAAKKCWSPTTPGGKQEL